MKKSLIAILWIFLVPVSAHALELDLLGQVGVGRPVDFENRFLLSYEKKFNYYLGFDADIHFLPLWSWLYFGVGLNYTRLKTEVTGTSPEGHSGNVTALDFHSKVKIPLAQTRLVGGMGIGPHLTTLMFPSDTGGQTDEDAVLGLQGSFGIEQEIGKRFLIGPQYKAQIVFAEEDTFLIHTILLQFGARFR